MTRTRSARKLSRVRSRVMIDIFSVFMKNQSSLLAIIELAWSQESPAMFDRIHAVFLLFFCINIDIDANQIMNILKFYGVQEGHLASLHCHSSKYLLISARHILLFKIIMYLMIMRNLIICEEINSVCFHLHLFLRIAFIRFFGGRNS